MREILPMLTIGKMWFVWYCVCRHFLFEQSTFDFITKYSRESYQRKLRVVQLPEFQSQLKDKVRRQSILSWSSGSSRLRLIVIEIRFWVSSEIETTLFNRICLSKRIIFIQLSSQAVNGVQSCVSCELKKCHQICSNGTKMNFKK
jgi:hypothetical protein